MNSQVRFCTRGKLGTNGFSTSEKLNYFGTCSILQLHEYKPRNCYTPVALVTKMPTYTTILHVGETVRLTKNQNSRASPDELSDAAPHYTITIHNGKLMFHDPSTGDYYKSPTSLCKAKMKHDGQTNEWAGPRHCMVLRNGSWVSIKSLM